MHRLSHLRIRRPLGYLLLGLLLPLVFGIANAQTDPSTTETQATAQEVIENYESKINVRQDGRLNVTETITVRNTEGGQIKRGIYRYFPNPNFEITSVKRNGNRATYRTEINNGRRRIEIWKKDVYLDPGSYTYQIQYLTDQQIEDLGEQDRLYWNVTGQDWAFPIQQVQAKVVLPEQLPSDDVTLNAFTGYKGEQGSSYQAQLEGKTALFTTTRTLNKREGLSVIVEFPQGYIESSNPQEQFNSDQPQLTVFFSLLGVAAMGLSYVSYRQAAQFARNCPIYLAPGEQSRVKVGCGQSGNSDSTVFAWIFLGSSLATLAIALFLSIWIADILILVSVIGVILPLVPPVENKIDYSLHQRLTDISPAKRFS